jgi:hypothetical protein
MHISGLIPTASVQERGDKDCRHVGFFTIWFAKLVKLNFTAIPATPIPVA